MKKLHLLILIIFITCCLTSCNNNGNNKGNTNSNNSINSINNFTQTFDEFREHLYQDGNKENFEDYIKTSMTVKIPPDAIEKEYKNTKEVFNKFRWENCSNENIIISLKLYYEPSEFDLLVVTCNPLLDLSSQEFKLEPGKGVNYLVVRDMYKNHTEYTKEEQMLITKEANIVYCELSVNKQHYYYKIS